MDFGETLLVGWLLVGTIVLAVFLFLGKMQDAKKRDMLGCREKETKIENCTEAAHMMVNFMHDGMNGDTRQHNECKQAGCDGLFTIKDSKDIVSLVKLVHLTGGRLVVRRVESKDIECEKNTVLEVKKILSDMDIARARHIDDKFRRK